MKQPLQLCLNSHDEVFLIDLDLVLYFQSDDHYTHVYYTLGSHFILPYGLGRIEALLAELGPEAAFMIRMGRKLIINSHRIYRVNTMKEQLYLVDDKGSNVVLHIPKNVLRNWVDDLNSRDFTKKNGVLTFSVSTN